MTCVRKCPNAGLRVSKWSAVVVFPSKPSRNWIGSENARLPASGEGSGTYQRLRNRTRATKVFAHPDITAFHSATLPSLHLPEDPELAGCPRGDAEAQRELGGIPTLVGENAIFSSVQAFALHDHRLDCRHHPRQLDKIGKYANPARCISFIVLALSHLCTT